jgi:hypothetical protein
VKSGLQVISLRAVSADLKYNKSSIKEFNVNVNTDDDEPDTKITHAPAKNSASQTVVFTLYSNDSTKFEWQMDGEGYTEKDCESKYPCPVTVPGLQAYGRHRFEARAINGVSKDSTPATHEWTISHCNDLNRVPTQYAKIDKNGSLECIDCPHLVGANCGTLDGTWEDVYANKDWWTSGTRDDTYYKCPHKDSCQGGGPRVGNETFKSNCSTGYTGRVCALCSEGYFLSEEVCLECPETEGGSTALVMLVFGGVFLGFFLMLLQQMRVKTSNYYWGALKQSTEKKKKGAGLDRKTMKKIRIFARFAKTTLKTFITYLQILSVSDSAFKIPWPKGFLTFLRYLVPINLDFFSISGLGCLVQYKFYDSHLFMMLMPPFVGSFVYLTYSIGLWRHRKHYKNKFTKGMQTAYANHVIQFTMWITILVYPALSSRAIQYFTCSEKIDGKHYLMKDYNLYCYEGDWLSHLPIGIIGVALYPLGIPAFFGISLWLRRKRLEETAVLHRYGFLYEMYIKKNYWWDVYEMLQKLFLTGVIVLIFPGKVLQVVLVVLADLMFLMNLLIQKPHKPGPTRNLAMMANMALTLTMYCGLVLVTVEGTEDYHLLFDLVLIIMNGAVAVYAGVHIFPCKVCCIWMKAKKEAKKEKDASQNELKQRKRTGVSATDKSNFVLAALQGNSARRRATVSVLPAASMDKISAEKEPGEPVKASATSPAEPPPNRRKSVA